MTSTNKCQYWSEYEPSQCTHWDDGLKVCNYITNQLDSGATLANVSAPTQAPYCNLIGTSFVCNHFEANDTTATYFPRCILPDANRHVCNRGTGAKWVISSGAAADPENPGLGVESSDGAAVLDWDFSPITGYNEGSCDDLGTDTTCSGYSPQHMGFGRLVPSSDNTVDDFSDGTFLFSSIDDFSLRLPTNYVVYNIRALLSKCHWWVGERVAFIINGSTAMVELGGAWACNNSEDTSAYSDFSMENGAPCNGCKPECPYYTGVCWQYCVDEFTESGDPILAEQIHELRYYHKENQWTVEKIESYFIDGGNIYAWDGTEITNEVDIGTEDAPNIATISHLKGKLSYTIGNDGTIEEYQISAQQTYMTDFEIFDVSRDHLVLSEGTEVNNELVNFPTLVRELKTLPLDPIIKNKFSSFNVFESPLLADTNMLVYGKVFYSAPTYAINISDKEIASVLPVELYQYDSLLEIELALGTEKYKQFYAGYEAVLTALLKTMPQKIAHDELSEDDSSFLISIPTFYADNTYTATNQNTILVYQKTELDGYLFSKVTFEKGFVGGTLLQNSFKVEGDDKTTQTPFEYAKGFMAHVNKNGEMSFSFSPIASNNFIPEANYLYNDLKMAQEVSPSAMPSGAPIVYLGYKLYEITNDYYILQDGANNGPTEFRFLGSDGYMLISLEHPFINNVFKPWEFENITVTFIEEGNQTDCLMEVVHHGADGLLGAQQLIIKPKNVENFRSRCDFWITIRELKYWEKRSYDQEPEVDPSNWYSTLVEEEGIAQNYAKDTAEFSSESPGVYKLTNFQFTMVPSVVINNREGKPFTQYRTKAIGWMKQPYCPDVEIYYAWGANYTQWDNQPMCLCCGTWSKRNPRPASSHLAPPCGDHDMGSFSKTGPMWWPYNACDTFATYNIASNQSNYSLDVIGLFKETGEGGSKLHGDHDMRMLGPANYQAFHGRGCNFLLRCHCDWRTFNKEKKGDNYFTGYARIRGRISGGELSLWDEEGETMPKFGNVNRSQLNAYRTIDKWQYLKSTDGGMTWTVDWMVMPATMQFNKVDFTDTSDPMWDFGASQEGPNVVNPLGMYLAFDSLDGIAINESIDFNNRFNFDDVFNCRKTVDLIRYPATVGEYTQRRLVGEVYPWYEFKSYPVGGSTSQIQWAWQEVWKPLERNVDPSLAIPTSDVAGFIESYLEKDPFFSVKGPFIGDVGEVTGTFLFLDVEHPRYEYDAENREFRTILKEGLHTISLMVPEKDPNTGEYLGVIRIKLDDGKARGITWEGAWISEEDASDLENPSEYNISLYKNCIGGPDNPPKEVSKHVEDWLTTVTLFGTGYTEESASAAEEDDRMIKNYEVDGGEDVIKQVYFQRGLQVAPNDMILSGSSLPLNLIIIDQMIPSEITFTGICDIDDTLSISVSFDMQKKTLGSVNISYNFGVEQIQAPAPGIPGAYGYYHIPQVIIYSANDQGTSDIQEIFRSGDMELFLDATGALEVVSRTYTWDNSLDYIGNGKDSIIIEFRITPTAEELAKLTPSELEVYNSTLNLVFVNNTTLYEEVLTEAKEVIKVWERKYLVSYGGSGDSPPQGADPDLPVYGPKSQQKSTYYQRDHAEGIYNIPESSGPVKMGSKVFSRHLYEVHEDEEVLDEDIHILEGKQKLLYQESLSVNPEENMMVSITPPGLKTILNSRQLNYYPSATLMLHNSLVHDLADINKFSPMSGEGHQYEPSKPRKTSCDRVSPCGAIADDVFLYEFNNKDPQQGSYTGTSGMDAAHQLWWGTWLMIQRTELLEGLMAGAFSEKYGASSATKIWKDSENTELLFYNIYIIPEEMDIIGTSPSWNLLHFALSGNWQNAFFNVQAYEDITN